MLPKKLQQKLALRSENDLKRELRTTTGLVDFSSNDYLGFSQLSVLHERAKTILDSYKMTSHGATGSRLLTGNVAMYTDLEAYLADYYGYEAALIFNSGYDANLGLLASVPQRNDLVLYDEWVHASIRDGLQLSQARSHKFLHNDLEDLQKKLSGQANGDENHIYVVTESVFSMDGDSPDLKALAQLCEDHGAYLIVDEAHAVGLYSCGLVAELGLQSKVFAQIVTFGKALGSHGAAVLGSTELISYLINFARSLVYSTALPPHTMALIWAAHQYLKQQGMDLIKSLHSNIAILQKQASATHISERLVNSDSAIQIFHIPGNSVARAAAERLRNKGFDVRAILSPTVPEGKERLRICLHSFNTHKQIEDLVAVLATFA